jgi:hypothetical protein
VRPIRRATLLFVVALVAWGAIFGSLVRPVAIRLGATAPQVTWGPAIMFFATAVFVGALAWLTWQALHKKHERMTSDHGMKMLALSRASLIVGGLFAGAYGGYALSFASDRDTPLGSDRFWHSGFAAVAALLLLAAALLLERACRIPGGDDEEPEADGAAASAA